MAQPPMMLLVSAGALVNWMLVLPAPALPRVPINGKRLSVAPLAAFRFRLLKVAVTALVLLVKMLAPESRLSGPKLMASWVEFAARPTKLIVPLRALIAAVPSRLATAARPEL